MRKTIIFISLFLSTVAQSEEFDTQTLLKAAEIKYSLPEGLLSAIVKVESAGNHKAKNKDDGTSLQKKQGLIIPSYGLMQMQLASARFVQRMKASNEGILLKKRDLISVKQLMVPEVNVEYGAAYLKWLLKKSNNNVALALTCWNVGPHSRLCKNKRYYGEYVGKVLNAIIEAQ